MFEDAVYPQIYIYGKDIPMNNPPWMMVIISGTIGFSLLFAKMLQHFFNLYVPRKLLILVLTMIFVGVQKKHDYFQRIVDKSSLKYPMDLLMLYFPTFLLRATYSIDKKRFFRLLPISLIVSFVPFIGGFVQAAVLKPTLDNSWSYLDCVAFAMIFMTVQPYFLVKLLKSMDKYKILVPLFRGYAILSNVWCGVISEYVFMIYDEQFQRWYDPLFTLVKHFFAAFLLGFVLAKLTTLTLTLFVWDAAASVCILISSMLIGFYISNLLTLSEYLTVLMMAYVIIYDKDRFSSDTEKYIAAFFEFLATFVDMAIYVYCIFMITALAKPFNFKYLSLLAFNYIFVIMVRCALLILLNPIVMKIRKDLTFGIVIVLAWASTVGNVSLVVCLQLYTYDKTKQIALTVMPYLLFSALAGALINNTGISIILRTLNSNMVTSAMVQSIISKMNHLLDQRNNFIEVLKMNRRMSDVNWTYVKQMTTVRIPPPFPKNLEITGSNQDDVKICCNECPYDITLAMSPKKMEDFKRGLHKNLINEMKAILVRQHESGLISLEVLTALIRGWQIYLSLDVEPALKLEHINKSFKKSAILKIVAKCDTLGFTNIKHATMKPRKHYAQLCYYICKHKVFRTVTYVIVCWCAAEPLILLSSGSIFAKIKHPVFVMFHVFIGYFTIEFIITILSYAWARFIEGLIIYFSLTWNNLQFTALLLMYVELYCSHAYHTYYMGENKEDYLYPYIYYGRLIRFIRIIQVLIGIIPRVSAMLNTQHDLSVAFGYELAKALKECHDELLIIIDRVVENSEMREHFVAKISTERMILFTFILELQMGIPWLASTVKTRQMINSARCAMIDALKKMKYSGSVEDLEYNQILAAIVGKKRGMKTLMKIRPVSGLALFQSVAWIDQYTLELLYSHIQVEVFKKGKCVCTDGSYLNGVYFIISGLLKLKYVPTEAVVEDLIQNGQMPIIDYLNTTNVEKRINEYIIPGNTIGELSLLTGRPYNCTITAETNVKLYIVKKKYLKQAFNRQPDTISGIESRMWKYATINLATTVLMSTTAYQFYTLPEIQNKLERGFVPDLQNYKIFVVTNLMEDIILLKGVVVDFFTRDVYTAPCYLPRSVIKLCLAKCSFFNKDTPINTKLMIIPVPEVNIDDIMSKEEALAEFLPEYESKKFSVHHLGTGSLKHKLKSEQNKSRRALYGSNMEIIIRKMGNFEKRDSEPGNANVK